MPSYKLYLDGVAKTVDLDPNATLSDVRKQLNLQFRQYQFVYYNEMIEGQMILNHESQEKQLKLKKFIFEPDMLKMANVSSENPDFFGNRSDFFRDRNMGVRVTRNIEDGGPLGSDDFEPLMLQDVNPANPDSSDFFADNMVICQKGALVQFEISSWGAAGFGFSIKTQRDPIVDGLYCLTSEDSFGKENWITQRRYQGVSGQPGTTIKIESLEERGFSKDLKTEYSKITVKTWNVTSWTGDGKTHASALTPPSARLGLEEDSGDLFGGDPSGNTYVPAKSVQPAMPTTGKASSQTIGTVDDIQSDGEGHVIGAVTFLVFVFTDKTQANSVINILNSSQPLPFPV